RGVFSVPYRVNAPRRPPSYPGFIHRRRAGRRRPRADRLPRRATKRCPMSTHPEQDAPISGDAAHQGTTDPRPIERVAVVGAGIMGGGIATLLLQHGLHVTLIDPEAGALERATARIAKRNDEDAVRQRLALAGDLESAVADVDFAIEAAPERLELKRDLFRRLDGATPAHAVLASNTSELSVTAIAGATRRP